MDRATLERNWTDNVMARGGWTSQRVASTKGSGSTTIWTAKVANTPYRQGQLYYDNGVKAYEGQFKNDKFHNFGHLYNKWPSNDTKPFDYKNFKLLGDGWTKYEGDFQNDKYKFHSSV